MVRPKTVSNLTPEVLRNYFDARYSADNCILAASGRVEFDQLVEQAEELCGHWPATDPKRVHEANVFAPGELEVKMPEGTRQRYIAILHPSVGTNDQLRYARRTTRALRG